MYGAYYEHRALQYLAGRGVIIRNLRINGLEIDGILNGKPIEVKAYPLTIDALRKIKSKFNALGFKEGIVVAPGFPNGKFEGLELVRFRPDYSYVCKYYESWIPRIPKFLRLKWRQLRVETPIGFIKIKKRITSLNRLKNILKNYELPPIRVFFSVFEWLQPEKIGSKNFNDVCFGSSFLVFDIDGEKLHFPHTINKKGFCRECIENARRETIKLAYFLETKYGYSNFYVVFSGRKGFHLYVLDYEKEQDFGKFYEYREYRKRRKIVKDIIENGIRIDPIVTLDTRRIIGLPSSVHGYTGLALYNIGSIQKLEKFKLHSR